MESQKLCACNRTCDTLIGSDLELVDTVHVPFKVLVSTFCDVPESGVWLNHFRGIPRGPRLSRSDVIFLDKDARVLDCVENFTEVEFQPLHETAASAMVLPAHSLAAIDIQAGDQLRICDAGEVYVVAGQPRLPGERCILDKEPDEKRTHIQRPAPVMPSEPVAPAPKRSLKERFLLWLFPEAGENNSDRREAPRLPAQNLIAYCWTGGSPLPCKIANVSQGGVYLVTDERWQPGTRMMMTLQQDGADPGAPGETTQVESEVVRWGGDGIGCRFPEESVFVDVNSGEIVQGQVFDKKALARFLEHVTGAYQA
jgi:PilZ domain-containing protein